MFRIAVVTMTDDLMRRLAEPLEEMGFEPLPLATVEAAEALRGIVADAALVEFSPATRPVFDALAADKETAERLPLLAVLGPEQLHDYEAYEPAGDFVLWPALPEELAVRLRIAVRRRRGAEPEHLLRFGDLAIDLANYRVSVAGRHVQLTFKEYELLRFLATNRDKVFTREALLNRVWGYDYYGGARTVDVHIRRLRAKIESGHRTFIETIRNVGYRFKEED